MEKASDKPFTFLLRSYYLVTKPGIIMGNAVTMAAGFALASQRGFNFSLFLSTLVGLCMIIASACVFNNYIDRDADSKMARTKNRALVRGLISGPHAIYFAIVLFIVGVAMLFTLTNLLTLGAALLGFVIYVGLYSFSKYYTIHGILIGSLAGAVPPVVGYLAVSNRIDLGAIILFLMLFTWQMPHFHAISVFRLKDYQAASIPVLPMKRGMFVTKVHMLLYIIAYMGTAGLLTLYGYQGYFFLTVTLALAALWFVITAKGFVAKNETKWARQMFLFSLVVIMGMSGSILLSVLI